MKKLVLVLALVFFSLPVSAKVVELRSGTPVIVQFLDTIDSDKAKTGDPINANVVRDVVIDGVTVIQAGAVAFGTVALADASGSIGEAGRLHIQITSVTAVDGSLVPVQGTKSVEAEDETTGTVVVGVVLCPLALLNEGDAAQIAANTQVRVITMTNISFQSN